jgi:hypothetical protein
VKKVSRRTPAGSFLYIRPRRRYAQVVIDRLGIAQGMSVDARREGAHELGSGQLRWVMAVARHAYRRSWHAGAERGLEFYEADDPVLIRVEWVLTGDVDAVVAALEALEVEDYGPAANYLSLPAPLPPRPWWRDEMESDRQVLIASLPRSLGSV